jgi:cell shape-determining protein MreC
MPAGQLPLLLAAALLCRLAVAEEPLQPAAPAENTPAAASSAAPDELAAQLRQLQSQLADSERQRSELSARLEAASGERESAQLSRLRQENQRLKLQLKAAQASQPPRLLSEQQTWFAIGGGVALLSLVTGLAARGGRRQRRQWIN